MELFGDETEARRYSIEQLRKRGKPDVAAALIQLKRYARNGPPELDLALKAVTGVQTPKRWHDWTLWLQSHPEIKPLEGFDKFKADVVKRIDPNFELFLYPGVKHEIRLEEIVWGGVIKDGIPALTNPKLIAGKEAKYLEDDDLVFGVAINGDVRAYPLRIMDWHEMFNDVVGGVPVSLAYCTLCGSGILFDTTVAGRAEPFVFGSSGFLYRSNKLMYDRETNSLWNQFTGRPVAGTLTGSGIELKTRPVAITTWSQWKADNPESRVLSLETGHLRDYSPGAAYADYFSSPRLMFPALVEKRDLAPKDYVFALRSSGTEKAWPLSMFNGGAVINDRAGALDLVLIGDAATRTVRAYRTDGQSFRAGTGSRSLIATGKTWTITEDALVGPSGERLGRLPGHIAYWFAWAGYLGKTGEVATTNPG